MYLETLLQVLNEFTQVPSVVGHEKNFREYLNQLFSSIGYDTEITSEGLLVVKSNDKRYADHYTCSHIDRTGLVVENGKLTYAVHNLKDKLDISAKPTEAACEKIGNRFVGKKVQIGEEVKIVSDYEIVLNEKGVNRLEFILEEDMNLTDKDGVPVSYAEPIFVDNDGLYGQLDNVMNSAILYSMMLEGKIKGNIIFSTQEEVGQSGVLIANYLKRKGVQKTDNLLVLDTSPFSEEDYIREEVSLRNRDSRDFYSKNKVKKLETICNELKIPFRFKDKILEEKSAIKTKSDGKVTGYGLTELGKIVQESGGKFNGATLQLPNIGEGCEENISFEALINYITVLYHYYERL